MWHNDLLGVGMLKAVRHQEAVDQDDDHYRQAEKCKLRCQGMNMCANSTHTLNRQTDHHMVWRCGSALLLINEVNVRRARLVLGWATVSIIIIIIIIIIIFSVA